MAARVSALPVLGLIAALLAPVAPAGPASAAAGADAVTIAGSLQSELGCPGDWQPECTITGLAYDAEDDAWQATFSVPAGAWEYKAALNGTWDENYGAGAVRDGPNIALTLADPTAVTFLYDGDTHWVTDDVNRDVVVAPGSFQSELGCNTDWDPACLRSWLQDPDGDDVYAFTTRDLPAGTYEAKIAIGQAWDENYGAGGVADGPNIAFSVTALGDLVDIRFDRATNTPTVTVFPTIPVDDAALVREPVRHPFQDEILYFTIPDRFDNANTANDCGAYAGACVANAPMEEVLTHGFLPSDRGYYHGGDLAGLRRRLPYLDGLGISAIWVGPIFANKPVQPDSSNLYGHSSGYHGYWILDFLSVDPHLGTNEEFAALVDEAHARGIKVFMDIITNHTADVIQLEGNAGYRPKATFPYTDTSGTPFDDSEFAYAGQDDYTFPPVDLTSFPYVPVVPPDEVDAKNPAWLNDPLLYHNRGDTGFVGENSLYGDFFGLDDLWTERREVVEGMIEIYSHWIREFGVDGFRIDTTKHVNMEFWQVFGPAIMDAAVDAGIDHFFAFGEVFDETHGPVFMSEFSTTGRLPATIDFGFQQAARRFVSQSGAAADLGNFFAGDDYYTDLDSNAYVMPTFIGNHDMGRIGFFLQTDNPSASDDELLARSLLAHAMMFFSRGQPVIYYGDEQGFTGDGGDKLARQDMFANVVADYADDDLIGTDETTSDDNFDPSHPIYRHLRRYAELREKYPALRRGAQIERYRSEGPGVYAFSRVERSHRREHVVAFNNSTEPQRVRVPVLSGPGQLFVRLVTDVGRGAWSGWAFPGAIERADGDGFIEIDVPPLSTRLYMALSPMRPSRAAPGIEVVAPADGAVVQLGAPVLDGHVVPERIEVVAELDADVFAEVTFAVRIDGGDYQPIGVDDNAPYRVFFDPAGLPEGTRLSFRAIVNDLNGHLASDEVVGVTFEHVAPAEPSTTAVIHYLRDDGDYGDHTTGDPNDFWGLHIWGDGVAPEAVTEWTAPLPLLGETDSGRFAWVPVVDDDLPLNFIVHRGDTKDPPDSPDRSFVPAENREIWLRSGDLTVHTSRASAQGGLVVHHLCTAPCTDVALSWQQSGGAPTVTSPGAVDDDGAEFFVPLTDLTTGVALTVTVGGTEDVTVDGIVPLDQPVVWLRPGVDEVYSSRSAALGVATIHYRRVAGDYGDPSSSDFADFWGLHTWTGALAPTEWTDPLRPTGADLFGIVFEVPLVDGADQLAYILHRGETKDPGPDQFLVFVDNGHEVWQLEGTDPEDPYVLTSG